MIKIMVLDDDTDLLEMVCMMLTTPVISPFGLTDPAQILTKLHAIRPDVILMDIFLGNHDGRFLCKQIKASVEYENVPVILYSAGNIIEDSLRDCGADAFLRKPFKMQELILKIESLAYKP